MDKNETTGQCIGNVWTLQAILVARQGSAGQVSKNKAARKQDRKCQEHGQKGTGTRLKCFGIGLASIEARENGPVTQSRRNKTYGKTRKHKRIIH